MTTINLLPWREKKRQNDKNYFLKLLLAGFVLALFVVAVMDFYTLYCLRHQRIRNELLQKEVTLLGPALEDIKLIKQKTKVLESRLSLVQNLQSTRVLIVHLFDELSKVMTEGVLVTKLERKNNLVTLWGLADSNSSISEWMRNIQASDWITKPHLSEIKKRKTNTFVAKNEFVLTMLLKSNAVTSSQVRLP